MSPFVVSVESVFSLMIKTCRDEVAEDLNAEYKPVEFVTDVRLSFISPCSLSISPLSIFVLGAPSLKSETNMGRR